VNVAVDPNLCQGHARCTLSCPEVFDVDDDGFAVVLTPHVAALHEAAVEDAVLNCPERAISTS
jgi:ferredoxin